MMRWCVVTVGMGAPEVQNVLNPISALSVQGTTLPSAGATCGAGLAGGISTPFSSNIGTAGVASPCVGDVASVSLTGVFGLFSPGVTTYIQEWKIG